MYGLVVGQLLVALICVRFIYHCFIYLRDTKKLRRFPAVSIAGFTNLWAVYQQHHHNRTIAVHEAHKRLGPVVRVGTDHVSFSSPQAIRDIYGHGTPMRKATFYNAFLSTHFNISDAQDKSIHNVKRRRFAGSLAQKSIVQLETAIRVHLERLIELLDGSEGKEVNMSRTMMHFMFDFFCSIFYASDLNFLKRNSSIGPAETPDGRLYETDMYNAMIKSGHVGTCIAWIPRHHTLLRYLTQWDTRWAQGDALRDFTIHMVRNRVNMDAKLVEQGLAPLDDLFTPMLWDKNGRALGLDLGELVAESTNMVNAAGENTEIATSNTIWYIASHYRVIAKLREELDPVFDQAIPSYDRIKNLPYLRACIDESLRLRPSINGGLPRVVSDGMLVDGQWLEAGTTVSVSTHTIHRDTEIFHDDPEQYIPERWLREDASKMQRGFLAFSQGGRACIGRNIAYFEMSLVISLLFHRYDLELPFPAWHLDVEEHFSSHTKALPLQVKRRVVG